MREIKFRAWDEHHSKMTKPFSIYKTNFTKCENWIPLQYTGLKDKNGAEIYEGDIIKVYGKMFSGQPNIDFSLHKLEYYEDYGQLCLIGIDILLEDGRGSINPLNKHWTTGIMAKCYPIEVIGNIYENPELLENKPC